MSEQRALYVTPNVRAAAWRLGVPLNTVRGTGRDGRLRVRDVECAAAGGGGGASAPVTGAPRALASPQPQLVVQARSRVSPGALVQVDIYARNPLVEDAQQANRQRFADARAVAPPPTMFVTGDLPPFTGSGLDPQVLLQMPWPVRPAAAATTNAAAVLQLLEESVAQAADYATLPLSGGALTYLARVQTWLNGAGY